MQTLGFAVVFAILWTPWFIHAARAQSVCLPLPRLLSSMPMGGRIGTSFDVTITGENLEDVQELIFSHPGVAAVPKKDADGNSLPNQFAITIAPYCQPGLVEARVTSRLGVSSARIFSLGSLQEVVQSQPNTSLETAMPLPIDSVCNAQVSPKAVDHYSFDAKAGHRYVVHCSSRGIDSKLDPVVIIADAHGQDLAVERRGDTLDFTAKSEGRHLIKVHELTFHGGPGYFYRLNLQEIPSDADVPTFPSTRRVSAFSWPPEGLAPLAGLQENESLTVQPIVLPCDLQGRFFPAADVDTFEFQASQGDVWWVEIASERLGRPTDPSIVVQKETLKGTEKEWVDVAEWNDIASPMKPSSNGYAYDGPPYDGGSTDILGKLEVKESGTYRIHVSDLFGGTRRDPRNQYRMLIRRAAPDFALAGWGLHMELRNGDRNALSKPLALRPGGTVAIEVVAFRRDGFDGDIALEMDSLPPGVRATGLKIAKGSSRGVMLLTAASDCQQALSQARFYGTATVQGVAISRPVQMAQMTWPVVDAWGEIPSPRLVEDIPVSVTTSETAPLTLAPVEEKVFEVKAGETLNIPLNLTKRSEFSGPVLQLRTYGAGLEANPMFEVSLASDQMPSDQVQGMLQLTATKTPPGEYTLAFYGTAVAKYRYNPQYVALLEGRVRQAKDDAEAAKASTQLKQAVQQATPRDTAEIVLSEPIKIRVLP